MTSIKKDTPNTESHDHIDARIEKLKEAAALSDGQIRGRFSQSRITTGSLPCSCDWLP
jgi:hypothetical protein